MRQHFMLTGAIALFLLCGNAKAQNLPLPKAGNEYVSSSGESIHIWNATAGDYIVWGFQEDEEDLPNGFRRLDGNLFAELKYPEQFERGADKIAESENAFSSAENFIQVLPNDVLLIFTVTESGEFENVTTYAPDEATLKAAKTAVKEFKPSFDFQKSKQAINSYNQKLTEKANELKAAEAAQKAAAAKAEADAKAKAKAERDAALASADFCAPLNKYAGLVASRFKSLKGKVLPPDDMYTKGDTTFEAKEVLQYFDIGKIQTRHQSYDNATDLDFYMKLESEQEVTAKFQIVLGRLKTCFNEKTGWGFNSLGSSCSFVKGKVAIMLREFNNTWDENGGHFLHLQVSSK